MIRKDVDAIIDANCKAFEAISDQVWAFAEVSFDEHQSSKLQSQYMQDQGFRVSRGIAGMDTAFIAEWGKGKPVIAILGENDALPAQSQMADVTKAQPIAAGQPGHACGHNLLGTAGMEAACAAKAYLEKNHCDGTIRYYGCPAEEGGAGKVYMIMDGAFSDVDCTLTWHPGVSYGINKKAMAIVSVHFRFDGKASHAYAAPWAGRSALDAVELMNVGVNFLREHVKPNTYMHYAVTNSGGAAPNVVQQTAEVYYVLRSPSSEYLREVYQRVLDCAKGAALMTGTTLAEPYISSAMSPLIQNATLNRLTLENMNAYFPVDYTREELEYAKRFQKCGSKPDAEFPMDQVLIDGSMFTCTDAADVSWVTPAVLFKCSTLAIGTPGHSWNTTAQGKSPIAYRGMHTAAKIMANTLLDLIEQPENVEQAKEDFQREMNGKTYKTLMEGMKPGVFMRNE